jgi:transmembrane sensor
MESREQVEQLAAEWIARRGSAAWTTADASELEAWLTQSVSHRVAYYRLNAAWTEAGRVRALGGAKLPVADVLDVRTERGEITKRRGVMRFAIAAGVLVLMAAGLGVFLYQTLASNRFTTVVGGLQSVPMADGSRVTLNTDSQLRIVLSDRARTVDLDRGEAFFEVAHDPKRPFVVQVGNRRITALGTQFSVRREGNLVRVVVTEGAVRLESVGPALLPHEDVAARDSTESFGTADLPRVKILSAGSVARVSGDDVFIQTHPVAEVVQSLTWRRGLLTFRDTPLADAVAEFNRYNSRKIVIDDPAIAALEVGGVFRATNLDVFVRLLEQGFAVNATVEADRIILTASPHHP